MRHAIAVKFIALCLAALSLLAVIGSAAGIVGLAAMDLYDNSFDEYYNESMHSTRQDFAVNLVHRYASLNLGNLPDQYLNDYYGINWMYNTFRYEYFYYAIYNEHGVLVESTLDDAPEGGTSYEMVVTNLRYRSLVSILVEGEDGLVPSQPPATSEPTVPETTTPAATEETSVTVPNASIPTTGLSVASDHTPAPASEIIHGNYYDHEQGRMVDFTFTYEDLPPYTVELYLLPGAMPEEYAWTLLKNIWTARYELFWVLGISALLFAVFMVYLCVSAGRKKGTEEIRAGGLNCIPLDFYLFSGGCIGFFSVALGYEVLEFLMRTAPKILIPSAICIGYLLCLLVVAFCFACAAQFKTPGGYWWRNSLCGRFVLLIVRFSRWLERFLGQKFFPLLGKIFRKSWELGKKAVQGTFTYTEKFLRWLIPVFLASLIRKTWHFLRNAAIWLYETADTLLRLFFTALGKAFRWFGWQLNRFYSLLPLMWQWLVTGALLLLGVTFAVFTRSEGMLVLAVCLGLAVVIYGAMSFGILLDATKRMGKGDLETKVSDKNLVGSFREFAGDLNALADVAVVAAQKQLKSERMKTELITNVSHDIKTPLTSIINYVDLLQKPHTDEEQEVYLEVLSRQSGQLKKLIDDLMEMSKASTGNMTVEITAVNAVEAINQALGEFSDKLEKIQLTPVFRQPEEPIYMKADGRLAWRVLSNLLSNAYKYALPGTRLYIDLMELEGKVLISMKNISREELNVSADELLERFVRGDASRNTEGSGLGLNIAQSLMELQKGQLQLLVDGDLFKATLVFPAARIE